MVNNISLENTFGNDRLTMKIPHTSDARSKVTNLFDDRIEDINSDYFRDKLKEINISMIDDADNYVTLDGHYDCRDWAFDNADLPEYSWREGRGMADKLINKDLSGLSWVHPSSSEKSIVMYLDRKGPAHWGLIVPDREDIIVDSKWGKQSVYRHPLETVHYLYGDNVCFFKLDN